MWKDKFTVIANWKMNPASYAAAKVLLETYGSIKVIPSLNVIVAMPYIYLGLFHNKKLPYISFCGQNISANLNGAYTGDISASMLNSVGINYTIVGHSECRENFNENNVIVAAKAINAVKSGLTPIICIGETKADKSKGNSAVIAALRQQLEPILHQIEILNLEKLNLFIAYEPIWAIGTDLTVRSDYIATMFEFILNLVKASLTSQHIKVHMLYGGGINITNITSILTIPKLAGILVGSSSLDPAAFNQICFQCSQVIRSN